MTFVKRIIVLVALALVGVGATRAYAAIGIPVSVDLSNIHFTNGNSGATLTSQALPPQVVVYKPLVVPIHIANNNGDPVITQGLAVTFTYTLLSNGQATTPSVNVPVPMAKDPTNPLGVAGVAYVAPDVFQNLQVGDIIQYYVTADVEGQQLQFGSASTPYQTTVIDSLTLPVAAGETAFTVPDLTLTDRQTSGAVPTVALPAPQGTLTIQKQNAVNLPPFKGGIEPISPFTLTYTANGNSGGNSAGSRSIQFTPVVPLNGTFQYTLSYPASLDGSVIVPSNGTKASPFDLAAACYDSGINDWRIMGLPQLDTTLHTITFNASSLATCALFLTGQLTAADIRPPQRIITPNGDGINDTITFTGLSAGEQVKIFDIRGRRMREINGPLAIWDGRDDDGKIVPSGVYLYQYTIQSQRVSGVIVVAK